MTDMPMYEYKCPDCSHREDRFLRMAESGLKQNCAKCSAVLQKIITCAPMVSADLPGYESPVTGKWIEGRKARREDLARTHSRPFEPGEREEAIRRRAAADAKFDAEVDATIEATIEQMPTRKREQLDQELRSGAGLTYTRGTVS